MSLNIIQGFNSLALFLESVYTKYFTLSEQHAKHKIDISSNQISNGWLLEGVASVVGIFDEGAKEKIRLRKLPKKTAETIAIQMLPFEDCREREILTFDGDVELIIKEGEVYYLPN